MVKKSVPVLLQIVLVPAPILPFCAAYIAIKSAINKKPGFVAQFLEKIQLFVLPYKLSS
jgi:hypothetical protein